MNKQQLELYVNKADGVWQYDAGNHALVRVADAPLGKPLNDAPVVLIFAVPENDPCGGMHVGSVYQNVGLFCASAGLANVVKASTTRDQSLGSPSCREAGRLRPLSLWADPARANNSVRFFRTGTLCP